MKSHNDIVNGVCIFNKVLENGLFHNHVHDMAPNSFWMAEKLKIVWQSRWLHYDGNHVGLNGCSTYDEAIAIEEFHLLGNRNFLFITLENVFRCPSRQRWGTYNSLILTHQETLAFWQSKKPFEIGSYEPFCTLLSSSKLLGAPESSWELF